MTTPAAIAAALATGLFVAGLAAVALPPRRHLTQRVRPYTVAERTALGDRRDLVVAHADGRAIGGWLPPGTARVVTAALTRLQQLVEPTDDAELERRLRRAGLLRHLPAGQRAVAYRTRVLAATALGGGVGGFLGGALAGEAPVVLAGAVIGALVGGTRWRGRVDRAIVRRRERATVELYTVNQLLALHARTGGGVAQIVRRVCDRSGGVVAGELREALAAHRGGRPLDAALRHLAVDTAEPNAARTYRLLASGVTYGSDLAEALRRLSDDIREQRAEALRRAATRRRAAMLLPTIAILAPIMLLFVGAPLPSIVLGGLP